MTLVGKIMTVLIFVLAVACMMVGVGVYSTHKNWREAAIKLKKELDKQVAANRQLRKEISDINDEIARERAARRKALAAAETHLQDLRVALASAQDEVNRLNQTHQKTVETLTLTHKDIEALTDRVGKLRGEIRLVQADSSGKFQQSVALTDQLHELRGILDVLKDRNKQLVDRVGNMKARMDSAGIRETDPIRDVPPKLRGVVVDVRKDFVEISLGSDEGLRPGHECEVYRNRAYLGRIRVYRVSPDRAVAEIIRQNAPIQKDDDVETRTNTT